MSQQNESNQLTTVLGVIYIDIFNIEIPVFDDLDSMVDTMLSMDLDVDEDLKNGPPCYGMAVEALDPSGSAYFALYLDPDSEENTWVHEVSHIVDFIFPRLGIPTGLESTEIRSYLTAYMFKRVEEMMEEKRARTSAVIQNSKEKDQIYVEQ